GGSPGVAAFSEACRPWRFDLAGSPAPDRAHPSTARATGTPRPSDLWRCQLWLDSHLRTCHRPARPRLDVLAPDQLRADHADGGRAAQMARPVRLSAERGYHVSAQALSAIRDLIQED